MFVPRRDVIVLLVNVALSVTCRKAQDQNKVSMTVELDVYSGRPNPTWSLSAEEAENVAGLLANLPRAPSPPDEGLGYRGFILLNAGREGNLPERIRVSRGIVTRERAERAEHFVDAHGLEQQLLKQARKRGFGSVVDSLHR